MITGHEPNMSVGASDAHLQMETTQTRSFSVPPKTVLSNTNAKVSTNEKVERSIVMDERMS